MLRLLALLILCLIAPATALGDSPHESSEAVEALSLAPGDTRWVPLDLGNRWSYVYARERSRSTNRGEPVVERFRGTRTDEVRPADSTWGAGTALLQSIVQGRTQGRPADTVERQSDYVTFDGRSLRVLARKTVHPMGETAELVRFTPPLEAIHGATSAGHTWNVGTEQSGGVRTVTRGEVLGIQDARTPAGVFEKCLVVKRSGNIRGRLDLYGSEIEVRSGTVVTTEWYAPGVGLVLAKSDSEQTMVLEDGSIIDFVEKTQFALREVVLARRTEATPPAGPAAPAPPSSEPELNPQMPIPSHADEAGVPGPEVLPPPTAVPSANREAAAPPERAAAAAASANDSAASLAAPDQPDSASRPETAPPADSGASEPDGAPGVEATAVWRSSPAAETTPTPLAIPAENSPAP